LNFNVAAVYSISKAEVVGVAGCLSLYRHNSLGAAVIFS